MSNIQRISKLLDDYLRSDMPESVMREVYKKHLEPAYDKLSFRDTKKTFYDSDKLQGNVSADGSVDFIRKYPELNNLKSHYSPQEILDQGEYTFYNQEQGDYNFHRLTPEQSEILRNYKSPTRDLIKMNRAFQDYTASPDGARLYNNTPLSEHRADAYSKLGFQNVERTSYNYDDYDPSQYLDKRPYADQELFNKLYAVGDLNRFGLEEAQLTLQQRIANNKLGSKIVDINLALPEVANKLNVRNLESPEYLITNGINGQLISNAPRVSIMDNGDGTYSMCSPDGMRELNRNEFRDMHNDLMSNWDISYEYIPYENF